MNEFEHVHQRVKIYKIDGEKYELWVDLQSHNGSGFMAYFYFKWDGGESLRQPSFAYGGKTPSEALDKIAKLAPDDEEYLMDTLL